MKIYTNELKVERHVELNEDEKRCIQFLQSAHLSLVPYYMDSIDKGRKGILKKFAAAILREDLLNIYTQSKRLRKIGNVWIGNQSNDFEEWGPILRQVQKQFLREEVLYLLYQINKEHLLIFPIENEYAFGRFILTDNILLLSKDNVKFVETASELLSVLTDKMPVKVENLHAELENGTANYTLALAHFTDWKRQIKEESDLFRVQSLVDYAIYKKKLDSAWSLNLFFEQLSTEGHHLHPGAKTKMGMEPKDVFHFSPEFRQIQSICFVAVHKDYLLMTEALPYYIEENFPDIAEYYQKIMKEKGLHIENYRILPVHEWQYKNIIPSLYKDEIDGGVIFLLEGATVNGGASSSFRTIWPNHSDKPALKLSVNSQMTSTIRSISTQTAMNSVAFTNMMEAILKEEASLKRFIPINEVAGYSFRSCDATKSRNLTVVVRENIENLLEENEVAIAGCSLYSESPISGKKLLEELVQEYCDKRQQTKTDGAISFLKDYLSIIIPGYITLMVKYGVALEGHLQNSVPVFRDGKLVKFFFRDWGGSRILQHRLQLQGITTSFYDGSISVTPDVEEIRNKLFYTVFQNHLGELIVQLCKHSGLHERLFWKEVRIACDAIFTALEEEGIEWAKEDAASLYQPMIKHKALTKMRLYPKNGYIYSSVPNPLNDKSLGYV